MRRSLVLLFATFTLAAALGCGSTSRDCAKCAGCCNSSGTCQPGTTATQCGSGGASCVSCISLSCVAGQCGAVGGGSNQVGGGTGQGGGATGGGSATGGGTSTGGGFGTGGGGQVTGFTDYYTQSLQAFCALATGCGEFTSAAACEKLLRYPPSSSPDLGYSQSATYFEQRIARGDLTFSGSKADSCLATLRGASCSSYSACREEPLWSVLTSKPGTIGVGSACQYGGCIAGAHCSNAMCPSTCQPDRAVGQSVVPGQQCVETAFAQNGLCVVRKSASEPCASSTECAADLYCDGASGSCRAPPTNLPIEDQPCQANLSATCALGRSCVGTTCKSRVGLGGDCTTTECAQDLRCDFTTRKCVARKATGQACTSTQECVAGDGCTSANSQPGVCYEYQSAAANATCRGMGECQEGLTCELLTAGQPGTCKPQFAGSLSCSGLTQCDYTEFYCESSSCVARRSAGGACAYNHFQSDCLAGLFCPATASVPASTCAQKVGLGGTCGTRSACAAGLYCTKLSTDADSVNGTCQSPKAAGAACNFFNVGGANPDDLFARTPTECQVGTSCSGTSTNPVGTCVAGKQPGASCMNSRECLGSCNQNVCRGCTN